MSVIGTLKTSRTECWYAVEIKVQNNN